MPQSPATRKSSSSNSPSAPDLVDLNTNEDLTPDALIKALMQLQNKINEVDQIIYNNPSFKAQLELFRQKKLNLTYKDCLAEVEEPSASVILNASNEFTAQVSLYSRYAKELTILVERAIKSKMIDRNEFEQIIKTAKDAQYFPLYQDIYNIRSKPILSQSNTFIAQKKDKEETIRKNYERRVHGVTDSSGRISGYEGMYIACSFASLFGIGIPFLIGGMLVHAVDKLITKIRINSIESEIKKKQKETNTDIDQIKKDLSYYGSKDSELKQTLFQLCKNSKTKSAFDVTMDEVKNLVQPNKFRT